MLKNKFFVILTAFLLCSWIMPSFSAAEEFKPYFPLSQGSQWQYSGNVGDNFNDGGPDPFCWIEGFKSINGIDTIEYHWGTTSDSAYFTNDNAGFRLHGATDADAGIFPSPLILASSDILIGEEHEGTFNGITLNTKIMGYEDVEVPAYNGEALKMQMNLTSNDSAYTETWYFAKNIGLVKSDWSSDYSTPGWVFGNVELQSYTVTPEPISSALFLLGGGAMAAIRLRRAKLQTKKKFKK